MATFEKYDPQHKVLWDTMKIVQDERALHNTAQTILAHKSVYQDISRATGVPWQLIAVLHIREAGLQDVGPFKKCLHNGQPWSRRTTIEPKDLGPWSSFREAAIHALVLKGFDKIRGWTPAKMLSAAEPFNGYGYRNMGLRSPYLWASTNHEQKGKYNRDHVFDPNVEDTQLGVAAMLKYLGVSQSTLTTKEVITMTTITGIGTTIATFWETFLSYANTPVGYATAAAAVLGIGYYVYKKYFGK